MNFGILGYEGEIFRALFKNFYSYQFFSTFSDFLKQIFYWLRKKKKLFFLHYSNIIYDDLRKFFIIKLINLNLDKKK